MHRRQTAVVAVGRSLQACECMYHTLPSVLLGVALQSKVAFELNNKLFCACVFLALVGPSSLMYLLIICYLATRHVMLSIDAMASNR